MKDKFKPKIPDLQVHKLPAGIIPGDYNTELIGVRETRKVFAICNGATIPFIKINPVLKAMIFEQMLKDPIAVYDLRHLEADEALEEYAFCLYGQADDAPDFTPAGTLGKPENFTCGANCICLKWESKNITLNGHKLTPHQVNITQQLATDKADKQIADLLCISQDTLNSHKRKLFDYAGVKSKTGFARRAVTEKIVQ